MGCILGVCAAQAACCCASSACSFCCACCPSSVTSVMTRLMYLFMIILGILTASIFIIPQVKEAMSTDSKIPFYDGSVCSSIIKGGCEKLAGARSVYRVWFAFVMFFLLMGVLTFGVRSSKDCRASLQNGFWFFKFLILIGIMVGAFFIDDETFEEIWLYFGIVGGVLFILIQVVYLIDFAHSWTENWLRGAESSTKCYYVGFIFSSLVMYGFALAGFVGSYVYLTADDGCHLNKGLISVNLTLCIIGSVIAVLPSVQNANPSSGILQASLVSLYVSYLTFSAVGANPEGSCKEKFTETPGAGTAMIVVGIVVAVMTMFFVSFKVKNEGCSTVTADEESHVQTVADDEEDDVQYVYWFFHLLCLLGSLYLMMVMTNWYKPDFKNGSSGLHANWPAVWVQIVSSWLCIGIYVWTLIAPVLFPNRNFSWVSESA